jgi:hypothetical protein
VNKLVPCDQTRGLAERKCVSIKQFPKEIVLPFVKIALISVPLFIVKVEPYASDKRDEKLL